MVRNVWCVVWQAPVKKINSGERVAGMLAWEWSQVLKVKVHGGGGRPTAPG